MKISENKNNLNQQTTQIETPTKIKENTNEIEQQKLYEKERREKEEKEQKQREEQERLKKEKEEKERKERKEREEKERQMKEEQERLQKQKEEQEKKNNENNNNNVNKENQQQQKEDEERKQKEQKEREEREREKAEREEREKRRREELEKKVKEERENYVKENEKRSAGKPIFYNYTNPIEVNDRCIKHDGHTAFHEWVHTNSESLCMGENSYHVCHKNPLTYPSNKNGAICEFKNAILDTSQWQNNLDSYQNPWANPSFTRPLVFNGFLNMQCEVTKQAHGYFKEYTEYFESWKYQKDPLEEDVEELAPGKTVFIVKRYPDSNNLFHGATEVFHAFSIMNMYKLSPEDIVVLFVDSTKHVDDPISRFWKQIISRGGTAMYMKELNRSGKRYHITHGIQIPIDWDTPFAPSAGLPGCKKRTAMYQAFYDAVYKFMKIPPFEDKLGYPEEQVQYPKGVTDPTSSQYTKFVTIQWRQPWPRTRKGQYRIMGNGKDLLEAVAEKVPSHVLVRLINTAEFTMEEQIGIMARTDYFVGLHGAGFTLTIFMPEGAIVHEVLHRSNVNWVIFLSSMSGHPTYSNILPYRSANDGNELINLDPAAFTDSVLGHMNQNNFF